MTPEQKTKVSIDALQFAVGWQISKVFDANIPAFTGVVIRKSPLNSGYGSIDYLLYVNGKA